MPDFYRAACRTETDPVKGNVRWLNVEDIRVKPQDNRQDISQLVISGGGNLHTADVNLALNNLIEVAASQSRAYVTVQRNAAIASRASVRRQLTTARAKARSLSAKARKAKQSCAKKKRSCAKARNLAKAAAKANRKVASLRKSEARLTARINSLVGPEA